MVVASCMPVMHGSQGCTSFGIVLMVRHFKEAIPLQTTAMNEATTIMGGYDNVEKALLNIRARNHPQIIGLCSTGLTETKGDDVVGYITTARQKHPELNDTAIVYVSTPDYVGAFQDGWAAAVTALVSQLPALDTPKDPLAINVLPGCHLSPGDLEHLRELIESFGLRPTFVPDVSGSLDGHIPDQWLGTTIGGTPLADLQALGGAVHTLAIGEQMRGAAQALQARCGVPFTVFDRLTGLTATDALVQQLATLSGQPVPAKVRRQRSHWWTPCSTATSTSAMPASRWRLNPTCCWPPGCSWPRWAPSWWCASAPPRRPNWHSCPRPRWWWVTWKTSRTPPPRPAPTC